MFARYIFKSEKLLKQCRNIIIKFTNVWDHYKWHCVLFSGCCGVKTKVITSRKNRDRVSLKGEDLEENDGLIYRKQTKRFYNECKRLKVSIFEISSLLKILKALRGAKLCKVSCINHKFTSFVLNLIWRENSDCNYFYY